MLACAFILSCSVIGHADEQTTDTTTNKINQRIQQLDNRISVLEGQKENLQRQVDIAKNDVNSHINASSKNIESRFNNRESEWFWLKIVIAGFGVIGFLYIKDFIQKKAEETAENQLKQKISELLDSKQNTLLDLISQLDLDAYLRENSNIHLITESLKRKDEIFEILREVGFDKITYDISKKYKKLDPNVNLILLDDGTEFLDRKTPEYKARHNLFNKYIDEQAENSNTTFIFYGQYFDSKNRKNVNFANTKFTLYSQIINNLRYTAIKQQNDKKLQTKKNQ